jgi:hypothetical protein
MDIELLLLEVFEKTVISRYPGLHISNMKGLLKRELEKKRFDTQDEAIIEAILRDKEKPLEESFIEGLDNYINEIKREADPGDFRISLEEEARIVDIFFLSLERLVDYIYNALINKHFFGA